MKILIKVTSVMVVVAVTMFFFIQSDTGKGVLGELVTANTDLESMIEKEKTRNIEATLNTELSLNLDGQSIAFADVLYKNMLVLPYKEDCPPCDAIVKKASQSEGVRFMVLSFEASEAYPLTAYSNQEFISASTEYTASRFYMDSMLSPVLYHITSNGRIAEKFVGLNEQTLTEILHKFKG